MADFNGSEGSLISAATAGQWTKNYRDAHPTWIKGHFFGKNKIGDLLRQTGSMGIRVYYAIDDSGVQQLIMVAAKANKDDMLEQVLDMSIPCPDQCGANNVLNS